MKRHMSDGFCATLWCGVAGFRTLGEVNMKLIFMSFTGKFGHQGDYMKNCCHFLNQFIFVSLFVYFCLCCVIVCLSALPF